MVLNCYIKKHYIFYRKIQAISYYVSIIIYTFLRDYIENLIRITRRSCELLWCKQQQSYST